MSYRISLILSLLLLSGCTASPLTAPTPTHQPTTLIILTYERSAEQPISVGVSLNGQPAGYTNTSGVLELSPALGREAVVRVDRAGYGSMEVAAVIESTERWTFYLERLR